MIGVIHSYVVLCMGGGGGERGDGEGWWWEGWWGRLSVAAGSGGKHIKKRNHKHDFYNKIVFMVSLGPFLGSRFLGFIFLL